jgi:hypothetical protein
MVVRSLSQSTGVTILNDKVNLPQAKRVGDAEFEPIYELREIGVVSAGTICEFRGSLFLFDVTEIKDGLLAEWFDVRFDPYSTPAPDSSYITRTPFRALWSNDPLRWRRLVNATIDGNTLVPEMNAKWKVGDKVSFIEAEDLPATAEDITTTIITSATITAISGSGVITIDKEGQSAGGYLIPEDYFEQLVGYDDLRGTGRVIRASQLDEQLVITLNDAILLGVATGNSASPFVFSEAYVNPTGDECIWLPWSLATIDDRIMLYRGRDHWFTFELTSKKPKIHQPLEATEGTYFASMTIDDELIIADCTIDSTLWIGIPGRQMVVLYDYRWNKVRIASDVEMTAAATVKHPSFGSSPRDWIFLIGLEDRVVNYRFNLTTGEEIYTREGLNYEGSILFGLFGDPTKMSRLVEHRLLLDSKSPNHPITVRLHARNQIEEDPTTRVDVTLESPLNLSKIKTLYRAPWWQEEFIFSHPVRIAGRVVEVVATPHSLLGHA